MANIKSSKKRAVQNERRRKHNASMRSAMRTAIKKVIAAISSKDKTKATAAYQDAVSNLDSMSNKGIIHKNKAARHKSRLNSKIKAMA